jgi:hypothetical protein
MHLESRAPPPSPDNFLVVGDVIGYGSGQEDVSQHLESQGRVWSAPTITIEYGVVF